MPGCSDMTVIYVRTELDALLMCQPVKLIDHENIDFCQSSLSEFNTFLDCFILFVVYSAF